MAEKRPRIKTLVAPQTIDDTYLNLPDGYWSIVVPNQGTTTNLVVNPSLENDVQGVTVLGGSFTLSDSEQYSGIRSLCVVPNGGVAEVLFATATSTINRNYCMSFCINGPAGEGFNAQINNGPPGLVPTLQGQTIGQWECHSFIGYPTSSILPGVFAVIELYGDGPFYVDAVQLTQSEVCYEYFDGDTLNAEWNLSGTILNQTPRPHFATSNLSRYNRRVGQKMLMSDMGFDITSQQGHLMTPRRNVSKTYAQKPGALFQRDQIEPRRLRLSGLYAGCDTMDLHEAERSLIEALVARICTQPEPLRLCYQVTECADCLSTLLYLDAYYSSGFEGYQRNCLQSEFNLEFVAYDPYFRDAKSNAQRLQPGLNRVEVSGTAPCDFCIVIRTGSSGMNLTSILNTSLPVDVYFGNPTPGIPMGPGETWTYCTASSRLTVEFQDGSISDQTGLIHMPLSCPSDLKIVNGENRIEIGASALSADSTMHVVWNDCYDGVSGVKRK